MADKGKIWFIVVNAYAASSSADCKWAKAESILKQAGVEFHMNRTGRSGNAMEIAFDACMAGYRRIVAAGGDGTVHDVLNGIGAFVESSSQYGKEVLISDFTLGVIPLGSGNDWIKSLGIPNNIKESIRILSKMQFKRQDVVRVSVLDFEKSDEGVEISRSYMANVGGVGIDAKVCEMVNAKKKQGKRGKILYVTSLIKAIRGRTPCYAKIVADGEVVYDGAFLSIAFGIGKYSGGGMRQTPEAIIDDGLLDMTIIPELPIMKIACKAPRLFTGSFLKIRELISTKSKEISVIPYDSFSMAPVEVDGEVVGKSPVRLSVLEHQINIVVSE